MTKPNTNESRLQVVLNVTQLHGTDKYGNPRVRERTVVITATRERQYRFNATGLKPGTKHYLFFNGERVPDINVRPLNFRFTTASTPSVYGSPIVTDSRGRLQGQFLYRVNTPTNSNSLTDYYYLLNSVSGRKYIVITDYPGDNNFSLTPTVRASTQEYYQTMVDFLNRSAASYCVDYIDIKSKFNIERWLTRNRITVEG